MFFSVVIVEMRGQYGYLSAIDWPLLPVSCWHFILYFVTYLSIFIFDVYSVLRLILCALCTCALITSLLPVNFFCHFFVFCNRV